MIRVRTIEELILFKRLADKNPLMADLLYRAELPGNLQYVRPEGTGRRGGYYRNKSPNYEEPSEKQLAHRIKFGQKSYDLYGIKGVQPRPDGTTISLHASKLGQIMRGSGERVSREELERKRLLKILMISASQNRVIRVPWI